VIKKEKQSRFSGFLWSIFGSVAAMVLANQILGWMDRRNGAQDVPPGPDDDTPIPGPEVDASP
jgi:hypothetical protein